MHKLQAHTLTSSSFSIKNITIQITSCTHTVHLTVLLQKHHHTNYKPYSYRRTVLLYYKSITIQITSSTRTVLLYESKTSPYKLQAVLVQFIFTTKNSTIQITSSTRTVLLYVHHLITSCTRTFFTTKTSPYKLQAVYN